MNAAQYGGAPRRRRTCLFAYRDDTRYGAAMAGADPAGLIGSGGLLARAFPIREMGKIASTELGEDLVEVSDRFAFPFQNAGYMHGGAVYTAKVLEAEEEPVHLGRILQRDVEDVRSIGGGELVARAFLKGEKGVPGTSAIGHELVEAGGRIAFPDPWDRPGRTMLTSESTLNRSTHVVSDPGTGRLRLLTPVEAERLQGFDDGWTEGMPDRMRYFCMGNALVVPMITRMGRILDQVIAAEP